MSELEPIYHPNDPYTAEEKAHNRKVWDHALRSGKYAQGMYSLQASDNTFCCLGVLSEVMGVKSNSAHSASCVKSTAYGEEEATGHAPVEAMAAVGLRNNMGGPQIPIGMDDRRVLPLATLNDCGVSPGDGGLTFEEIADHLKTYEARYFDV